jgi:hypothetical protein
MDDLDDLMAEAKIEVKKGKKLSLLTPSARKIKIAEAEEVERKRAKKEKEVSEDGTWLAMKVFFGITVVAALMKMFGLFGRF